MTAVENAIQKNQVALSENTTVKKVNGCFNVV